MQWKLDSWVRWMGHSQVAGYSHKRGAYTAFAWQKFYPHPSSTIRLQHVIRWTLIEKNASVKIPTNSFFFIFFWSFDIRVGQCSTRNTWIHAALLQKEALGTPFSSSMGTCAAKPCCSASSWCCSGSCGGQGGHGAGLGAKCQEGQPLRRRANLRWWEFSWVS